MKREFTTPDGRIWIAVRVGRGSPGSSGYSPEGDLPGIRFDCLGSKEVRYYSMPLRKELPSPQEYNAVSDDQLIEWWDQAWRSAAT